MQLGLLAYGRPASNGIVVELRDGMALARALAARIELTIGR